MLPLALGACAGPPITAPIDGDPVCTDFEAGAAHTKMYGSLRFPVQLAIKKGDTPVFKTTILGRRTEKELPPRVLLADDDEKFTVEWGQCENERAPKPIDVTGHEAKGAAKYECGKSEIYKTEELVTKKGDPKSHAITFPAPPKAACWESPPPPPEAADAGAPDAAADAAPASGDAADAGDAGTDAAAEASDAGPATDAGTDSDGGKSDAGSSDAGAAKGF